jgi:hypothetical protein
MNKQNSSDDIVKDFFISGAEESVEKINSKLKFIAKIKGGEKVDVKSCTIHKDDMFFRARRTIWDRETKLDTFNFIRETYNNAVEQVYYYKKFDDDFRRNIVKNIITNIYSSFEGLKALMDTYSKHEKFTADLESLMETTRTKLTIIYPEEKK